MNNAVKNMLLKYETKSVADWENALREIIQEIALLGLWRSKFFEHAAFYGGTALRILYGLDRFSEDLDFSLLRKDLKFNITPYCKAVEIELKSFGFNTSVESAFIKADTIANMIEVEVPESIRNKIVSNKTLKVKLEIDKDPPLGFETEAKYILQPIPFAVNTYKQSSLFAGKLHAALCREWKSRVKARDWYDMIWYVGMGVEVNIEHLSKRMQQTGHIKKGQALDKKQLIKMLVDKLDKINISDMKQEIYPFLKRADSIKVWSKEFFADVISKIKII